MSDAIVSASMGVISTLLPKLSMLIQEEYNLQKGVKGKIAFLTSELSSMQTLLVKLANNEERLDGQLKDWRSKVRELSYDIEDCIDLFMHKMSKGGAKANLVKKTASKIEKIWSRHKIANLIDELKARVEEESDRRLRYKFDDEAINFTKVVHIDPRLPALYVEAEKLVGIDSPRKKIIEFLKNDDDGQQLKVVSIVGFGGLGKTTLANQVYQKIKGQFDCSCFVPVSRNPNVAKILANMLKELGSCINPSDDERQLIDKLRAFLQDKRYFIVVDDIWTTEAWKLVKSGLPENSLNSRIITTTRISNVATSCCNGLAGYVHNIQPLSDQQSQQLFFKRVFGDNSSCPPHLEQVSLKILEKCQGLPLAIITIGSMLAEKSKDKWEQVCNSIGSAFGHEGMREILLLSYYDLPYHLKTCLLYLSIYPEDYPIPTEELIWRWIAEGFIAEERGQTVDQAAKSYFSELVNRNLIQPIDIEYDGWVTFFKVHDMVLELIVSLSNEENFASIVEEQSYNPTGTGHKIRRLSIQSKHVGDEVMQKIMDKWSQVRSISFYGLQEQGISHLKELHHLRVLDLSHFDHLGNQHIKYIGSFFQLKYLIISSSNVTELPNNIGNLRYLQTLDLSGSSVIKLPPSVGHLQNLVNLNVDSYSKLPDEIGDLQALQELSHANISSVKFVDALRGLTKLKTLSMDLKPNREGLGHDMRRRYEEALRSSLSVILNHGLQSLMIFDLNDLLREELVDLLCSTAPCLWKLDVYGNGIARIPKQVASLVNLTHLRLGVLRMKLEDLCIVGGIPALLFCELCVEHAPDERLTISSQQFQCLKEFRYNNRYKGGGLEMLFSQGAMPELRRLHLEFRANQTESKMGFEFSFEHLTSLEHIEVDVWTQGATRSMVEASEAAVKKAVSIHPGHPTFKLSGGLEEYEERRRRRQEEKGVVACSIKQEDHHEP